MKISSIWPSPRLSAVNSSTLDQALLRLAIFSRQGYRVYVNGSLVVEQSGRSKSWRPRMTYAKPGDKLYQALKPGSNLIAVTSFLQYFRGKEGDLEVYLEEKRKDQIDGINI